MNKQNCPVSALSDMVVKKMTRSETKRAAVVEAARAVFLNKGFDLASMDEIAAAAGVSKRTVYFHFQSKDQLFANVMTEMCALRRPEVTGGETLENSTVFHPDRPIDEALRDFGERFLDLVFDAQNMSLLRILIGQTNQFPEIGREFFDQGPREMGTLLGEYLAGAQARGLIELKQDMDLAVGCFLTSMLTPVYLECLATACPPPDQDRRRQMVETAVHQFLCGTLVDRGACA